MTQEPLTCTAVVERLIGGERPVSDPRLSEHVGSCLSCFRTAGDLRGVPVLRRQLQEAQGELPDPGAAFWATFPSQISAAWQRQQEQLAAAAPVSVTTARESERPRTRAAGVWQQTRERFSAWVRMPLPAALTGALSAAAVVLLIMQTGTVQQPEGEAGATAIATVSPSAGQAEVSEELRSGGTEPANANDDPLKDLDLAGLRALRAQLEQTLVEGVRPRLAGEAYEQELANPTALSEELDELNAAGLVALAANLGEQI